MWYIIEAYVPLNNMTAVQWVEQELEEKPKELETILMGGFNARLGDPREKREGQLATALSSHGLEDVTRHFTPW